MGVKKIILFSQARVVSAKQKNSSKCGGRSEFGVVAFSISLFLSFRYLSFSLSLLLHRHNIASLFIFLGFSFYSPFNYTTFFQQSSSIWILFIIISMLRFPIRLMLFSGSTINRIPLFNSFQYHTFFPPKDYRNINSIFSIIWIFGFQFRIFSYQNLHIWYKHLNLLHLIA